MVSDEYLRYLTTLSNSTTNPALARQAAGVLEAQVWKFDPSEPRLVTGEWTAGGGSTVTVTPSREQQRQARANQRDTAAGATRRERLTDASQRADVAARLAGVTGPQQPKGAAANAVNRVRKELGIPTGKKFNQLPKAKQEAANEILTATRAITSLQAQLARQQARIDAINRELNADGARTATKTWLKGRLAQATAHLAAINAQMKQANDELAAGRKAWRRK